MIIVAEAIADAVNKVAGLTERVKLMPVLANVKIDIGEGYFKLTATDLEMTIIQTVSIDVDVAGTESLLVNGRAFCDILKSLEKGNISFELNNNVLRISKGGSVFDLPCADVNEYPEITEVKSDSSLSIPAQEFLGLLKSVGYAMSTDPSRHSMNSVCLASNDSALEAVATDSFRLAYKKLPNSFGTFKRIIPSRVVHEIYRLIGNSTVDVLIKHSSNEISLSLPEQGLEVRARLIDAIYPEYSAIINGNSFSTKITLNKDDLFKAVRQTSLISDGRTLIKAGDNNNLIVSAESELGIAKASLPIEGCTGEPFTELAFNSKLLLQAVSNTETVADNGKIVWEISSNGNGASFIRGENNSNAVTIIMPIKV